MLPYPIEMLIENPANHVGNRGAKASCLCPQVFYLGLSE